MDSNFGIIRSLRRVIPNLINLVGLNFLERGGRNSFLGIFWPGFIQGLDLRVLGKKGLTNLIWFPKRNPKAFLGLEEGWLKGRRIWFGYRFARS